MLWYSCCSTKYKYVYLRTECSLSRGDLTFLDMMIGKGFAFLEVCCLKMKPSDNDTVYSHKIKTSLQDVWM